MGNYTRLCLIIDWHRFLWHHKVFKD